VSRHPITGERIVRELRALDVQPGNLLMVHASLKALGPGEGGAAAVAKALLSAVEPGGTLMAYVSWDRSPYLETLNGARLPAVERDAWPAFDPATSGTFHPFGLLNAFLARLPHAVRSAHPDASMVAIGAAARELIGEHALGAAFGPGSPLERLVAMRGRILLLGASLDAVTVLHYAEAIADIPDKRRVTYEMPLLDASGRKVWQKADEYDSNGILDRFARPGAMDAVESIARSYVRAGYGVTGRIGQAKCHLFDARHLVGYGVRWLEDRFGRSVKPQ